MKLFQIVNEVCYYDMTNLYSSLEDAASHYPDSVIIVEAPDNVFKGWGYDTKSKKFIKPTAPDGWSYDELTGTFYKTTPPESPKTNRELTEEVKRLRAQLKAATQNNQFLEDCLVEMANIVYA